MIKLNGLAPSYPNAACLPYPKNTFFPAKDNQGGDFRPYYEAVDNAKAICGTCPHQIPCYAEALDRKETFGIWGGVNFSTKRRRPKKEPAPCPTKHTTTPTSLSPVATPTSQTAP